MAFKRWPSLTDQAWIQILALAERDEPRLHLKVSCLKDDSQCVLAGTDSKHSGRKKTCFKWSKMNRSEVCLGVGAYDNNEWRHVKFGC